MNSSRYSTFSQAMKVLLSALLLVLLLSLIYQPLEAAKKPKPGITWTPNRLEITVAPGSIMTVDVMFSSATDLTNASVIISKSIAGYISVDSYNLGTVLNSVGQEFQLQIQLPEDAKPKTYRGNIQIKQGNKKIRKPMQVTIQVVEPTPALENLPLSIDSPFVPGEMISSNASDAIQISTASTSNPFQEFSIVSVAFGTSSPIEALPVAESGGAETYRTALADFRTQQGGTPTIAPAANLFGQSVVGSYSVVNLPSDAYGTEQPTVIIEWVAEAESHLWIIRAARDVSDGTNPAEFVSQFSDLAIDIDSTVQLQEASSSESEISFESERLNQPSVQVTLPTPNWWSGTCNVGNHPGSYQLGTPFEGLVPCGPIGADVEVSIPGETVPLYEWQCTELVKRYLYLKYDIAPYPGHGSRVVSNMDQEYIGTLFERIENGEPNRLPVSGDVLSLSGTTTAGHTAIVTSTNVNPSGNGSIQIIEQNASQNGRRTLNVKNWRVDSNPYLINWLHEIPQSSDGRFCDDFSSIALKSGWNWVDPLGDSSYSLSLIPGKLRLSTPDGEHDLYPVSNLNAPRMLQKVTGDFDVTTKVTINPSRSFQGAGLLVWQDQNNYIRLERAYGDGINKAYRIGGYYYDINPDFPTNLSTVFLKITRTGNSFRGYFSGNGVTWTEILSVNYPAPNTLWVGMNLVNQWQNNPIWADFDFFNISGCPSN